jgi:hypothetical protein
VSKVAQSADLGMPDRKTDFYLIGILEIKVDSTWSQGRTW